MAVLTLGLRNLRRQIDAAFPGRDKTSDGWIGDAAHQAETSGHNPDDTAGSRAAWNGDPDSAKEVRAWDMDDDIGGGVGGQTLVDHLRRLPGLASVIRYMIYNRRQYHERNGFAPTPYTGDNPHTDHIHFEGAWTQAADDNTGFNYRLEEIPVALTADDKKWISDLVNAVVAKVWAERLDVDVSAEGVNRQAAGSVLAYTSSEHHRIEEKVDQVLAKLESGDGVPASPSDGAV
jgi:hypothetical protein